MSNAVLKLKKIEEPKQTDVIAALAELTETCEDFDYYLPKLITDGAVVFHGAMKDLMIHQLRKSIIDYARLKKYLQVSALIRMLDKVEGR